MRSTRFEARSLGGFLRAGPEIDDLLGPKLPPASPKPTGQGGPALSRGFWEARARSDPRKGPGFRVPQAPGIEVGVGDHWCLQWLNSCTPTLALLTYVVRSP